MKKNIFPIVAGIMLSIFGFGFPACGGSDDNGLSGNGIGGGGNSSEKYEYPKPSSKTIRLLTYNSYYCRGNTGAPAFSQAHIDNFAEVIKTLNADIASIQELDSGVAGRSSRFLLDDIRKSTDIDYRMIYSHASPYDGGTIGCGILIKKSLHVEKVEMIPMAGDERRMLIIVSLKDFVFMGTHLDLNDHFRKQSAETIVYLSKQYGKPVFLAGDLNDSHKWANGGIAFPTLMESFVIKSATDGSLPGQTNEVIDYILLNDNGKKTIDCKGTQIVKNLTVGETNKDLKSVSDHYPVYLDIEIK